MDPPPARRPASKRRDRRRRRRRRSAAAAAAGATGVEADVVGGEQGSTAPGNAAPAPSSSRRRDRRRRRRRRRDRATAAAPSTSMNPEAAGSDAQEDLHGNPNCVTETTSAPQADFCLEAVAAHLPQTITKKVVSSNKRRKENFQAGNKVINVSAEDGAASSSLACEDSVGEIEALRSKFFKKSCVRCPCNNCIASGNAGSNMDCQTKDPNCPEMKNIVLSGNSEEINHERMSTGCFSLQELEECKENENGASLDSGNLKEEMKKRRKRRGGKKHNCRKKNTLQESEQCKENENVASLNSSNLKEEMKKRKKRRGGKKHNRRKKKTSQDSPLLTGSDNSVSVDHANTTEEESVNLDSTTEKRCEIGRSNSDCTNTEINALREQDVACILKDHDVSCMSPSSLAEACIENLKFFFSPRQPFLGFPKRKLLILDLNGLLADINQDYHNAHMADAKVRGKLVFRRPYCDDFLNFCAWNFELGIWSSRKRENVASVVDILMKDFKPRLLFCWDMSKCTFTGVKTLENMHKPLMLKELRKLWNKEEPDLPWEEGDYSPSNTLLVDDSPYKALRNPPHTAIFPQPFSYLNWEDNSLGPGGDLRMYLQNLAAADDVECYVRNNPFGQPFITESDPHWNFYAQIADKGGAPLSCCA
ncbi:hypothetical protein ACP70R_025449 [Stipagrostis hirtigluma subsp. patula]